MTMWLNPGGEKHKNPFAEKAKQTKTDLDSITSSPEYLKAQTILAQNSTPKPNTGDNIANGLGSFANGVKWYGTHPGQLFGEIGQGLASGLNKITSPQNIAIANELASKPGIFQKFGQEKQQKLQAQQEYFKANPANTVPGMLGEQIPELPLWIKGEGAVSKLASKIPGATKLAAKVPNILTGAAKDAATYGAIVAPTESIREGDNLQQFLEREKQLPSIALGGLAFRGAGKAVDAGLNKANPIRKIAPELQKAELAKDEQLRSVSPLQDIQNAYRTPSLRDVRQLELPLQRTLPAQSKLTWTNRDNIPSVGPAPIKSITPENVGLLQKSEIPPAGQRLVQSLNGERLGRPAETLPQFNVNGPQVQSTGIKRLSFPDTVVRGDITDPKLAKQLEQTELNYGSINNPDTLEVARNFIQKDKETALHLVMSDAPPTAESNAVAQLLIKEANDTKKFDRAIDIVEKIGQKARTQGQAIQALSMWGRLTPEGVLRYADRVVKQAHEAGKIAENKVSEGTAKSLVEQAKELQKLLEGSRERQVATAKMLDNVAAQVPASFGQKVATLQTMAQLLNPKTAGRNILGNTGFAGLENVSQTVGTGIDKAVGAITGQRTMSLPSLKTQVSGGKTGWKLGLEDAVKGINTSSLTTQFDIKPTRTFRSGLLGKLETALNIELRAPDRAFYQAAYDDSLRSQMKAAKVSEPTEAMKEIADHDGLYRTFQDDNALSNLFSNFKKGLNKLTKSDDFGIGDFVLKYPRTPANLLARGIDYSPAGFVKVIMETSKPLMGKQFNQREFVQSFSRALTGSVGLVGMGALLHRTGIISGARNQDPDVASMEDVVGLGDYKINVSALKRFVLDGLNPAAAKLQKGDTLVTYDWFQPQALPVAMGADIDKNGAKAQGIIGTVLNGLATGANTFADQPVMQGVSTLLGQRDFSKGVTQIMQGIPASFVPTVLNQSKQLLDNQKRNTYSPNWLEKTTNLAVSKLPLLEKKLQPAYDALGNPVQTYQNGSNNPFNVFLNPSFISQYAPSKEAELALNAYQQTGETKQIPTIIPKYFTVTGRRFDLTPKQYAEMQQIVGQETKKAFSRISPSSKTDDQINQMTNAIEKARLRGKKAILDELGVRYKQSGNTLKLK